MPAFSHPPAPGTTVVLLAKRVASADAPTATRDDTLGLIPGHEEATMPTPSDHSHESRRADNLADLLEDFGFGVMLFSGVAIALVIVLLMIVL